MSDFSFKETEKTGLRKMSIFYFDNPIDNSVILAAETIIEQFLSVSRTEFTKKRGGSDYANIRNIRGGWRKVFHREFDNRENRDSMILTMENSEYTEWGASYSLKAKSKQGIPCPNFIQAFSNAFYSRIEAEHTEDMGIHRKFSDNMLFLDILDWAGKQATEPPFEVIEARYTVLYKILKPLIIPYERPVYLKPNEWVKRQERFEQ